MSRRKGKNEWRKKKRTKMKKENIIEEIEEYTNLETFSL